MSFSDFPGAVLSNPGSVSSTVPTFGRKFFLAFMGAGFVAALMSRAVEALARGRGWPHPFAIGSATLLFVMPLIAPSVGSQKRMWIRRLSVGVVSAAFAMVVLR